MKHSEVRTPLAKVRGWGSAKDGTSHFIWQRLTAIVLIPLTMWFVSSLMRVAVSPDPAQIAHWLSSGPNAAVLIIMLLALFHHAKLGVQVIIEDYLHCPLYKYIGLLLNIFLMYGFAIISVLAVLKLHLSAVPQ